MIVKMLIFPVILLIILYFSIAFIVPTAKLIPKAKEDIAQKEATLAKAKKQLGEVQAFQQDIDGHPAEVEYISDFVPNNQREEILLSDISQLAKESGVNLFSVGFSEGRAKTVSKSDGETDINQAQFIESKMIASGNYDSFKKFAHKLFRIKRLYDFKTFDLSKVEQKKNEDGEEQQNSEPVLNGTISFTYEYIPGKAQVSFNSIGKSIDYELINAIMNSTSQTSPLVPEPNNRKNPFLP